MNQLFPTSNQPRPGASGPGSDASAKSSAHSPVADGSGRLLRKFGHVTPREFKTHFLAHLRERGVSQYHRERIEEVASGFLDHDLGQIGMNHNEVREFLGVLREKRHDIGLSDADMGHIEEGLAHEQ